MDPFTFAFITDVQIGAGSPNGLRGEDSDKSRFDRAVDFVNKAGVDFVIFGGDQINVEDSEEQLDVFLESAGRIEMPWYGVAGNHDQSPTYLEHEDVPVRFTLNHKGCYFVGYDAWSVRGNAGPEPQKKEISWLTEQLRAAPADARFRFVVTHWPLFMHHPDEEDSYWNMPNRHELLELFKEHNVDCILSGHLHHDIDTVWSGLRMISAAATSVPLHYPEEMAFKLVTVFDHGFSMRRVSVAVVDTN